MYKEVRGQLRSSKKVLNSEHIDSSYSESDSDYNEDEPIVIDDMDDNEVEAVPFLIRIPPDKYNLTYIIIYLQGMCTLLPWNFFITADDYFNVKFAAAPSIQKTFENSFSVAAMVPNVLSSLLNVYLTHHTNRDRRLITCMVVMTLCFGVTAALVKFDTSTWTDNFFIITVALVVVINISSTIYQNTFFGLAGIFGDRYSQALMGGQGLGGTFAALASVITILGSGGKEDSAFSYFLTAVFVIGLCAILYAILFKLEFVKFQLQMQNNLKESKVKGERPNAIDINGATDNTVSFENTNVVIKTNPPYWKIFCQISPMALSVGFIFFTTLLLFPSITSGIESVNKANGSIWTNDLFSPLTCFLLFNLGDLAGRTLAALINLPSIKSPCIPILSLARVIFIPLFVLCNYHPQTRHSHVYFQADYYPVIFMVIFSLSNGFLGTKCMMYGPQMVPPCHAETAGTIMALFLSSGLALGALFSFLITTLI